ncbi:Gfo/Idh/MocA family oxidoreductase [Mesorhizobium sp. BAC0120]|uniref:Gfo/Idh/MocA family protein n=1 Tax=Mesorhizobium sp. BAC0120 TaxID=3090670 RepID=UPI00298BF863|nr:Gfo/Idh/MocA family oxidoreductase [Mesorhizobium sp. BAC0120]MDW6020496.1 Gfo/Idh/MocA family oxidoreductase [Mesorhizobium sp. BAC0120]
MASKKRSFSWGIIGTGTIARQFAADLRELPQARIAAVCSRSPKTGGTFAEKTGGAKSYVDLDAFLTDPAIEAVYIATPNALHATQAVAALKAGKAVLIEKPVATSSRDAQAIADAAERSRCFAMEAMWSRFLPAVQAARALLREGAIGDVTGIEGELAYRQDEQLRSRFFDPALGGGASLDLGVYLLSLATDLLGDSPTAISGRWRAVGTGVDMRAEYHVEFGTAKAALFCGFDRNGRNALTVYGTKGAIRLNAPFIKAQSFSVYSGALRDLPLVGSAADVTGHAGKVLSRLPVPGRRVKRFAFPGGGLQFEAKAVMEAVRSGAVQSDVMPLAQSVAVLRMIEKVLGRPPENRS